MLPELAALQIEIFRACICAVWL